MTESVSFLAASLAMYAMMLAVERPTVGRQFGAIGAIGLAAATRAQFGVLFVAYLAALAGVVGDPAVRPTVREGVRRLWPTLGALALGVLAFFARRTPHRGPLRRSRSDHTGSSGAATTRRGREVDRRITSLISSSTSSSSPCGRAGRALAAACRDGPGRPASGASPCAFLTVNTSLLLVAAAFASLPYGYDRLHDRYLFYVVPLWLIVFFVWLADGLPRPLVATATGVGLALVLPAILPFAQLANEAGVDTVPGALWVWLETHTAGPGPVSGRRLLAIFVIVLVAAVVLVPRRYRLVLPSTVLVVFGATAVPAWDRMIGAPEDAVFREGLDRSWIDDRLPHDARVWKLYIEAPSCPASALTRHSLFLTEFFNATVYRAAFIGDTIPDGIPIERVDVGPRDSSSFRPGGRWRPSTSIRNPGSS